MAPKRTTGNGNGKGKGTTPAPIEKPKTTINTFFKAPKQKPSQ